jgi:crossover junction endodeoxyribonuclease RuvC
MSAPAGVGLYLGIDPGLASTGWGVLDPTGRVVACGTVKTAPGPDGPRLLAITCEIERVIGSYRIAEGALEELFMGANRTSVIGVAQARGIVLLALERAGVPVFEYKPATVKATITGYGAASKQQMARMLAAQGVKARLDDHAADAIAIAICHSRSRRLRLAEARVSRT